MGISGSLDSFGKSIHELSLSMSQKAESALLEQVYAKSWDVQKSLAEKTDVEDFKKMQEILLTVKSSVSASVKEELESLRGSLLDIQEGRMGDVPIVEWVTGLE